jgi:hypothetical protein
VALLNCARTAGADGVELVESYPREFTPQTSTRWRKRLRDEINYRAQVGYTRYFLPGPGPELDASRGGPGRSSPPSGWHRIRLRG